MDPVAIVFWSIVLLIVVRYTYKTYNLLIYHKLQVDKQASNIDVHLKKRFDLIPQLVQIVKGYTKHEKSTFKEVTELRSQWAASRSSNTKMKTANMLEAALSKLLVIQEQYPKLKANKSFLSIQKSLSKVESELVHERKMYNQKVKEFNINLQLFPKNIVGKVFRFKQKPFFSFEA